MPERAEQLRRTQLRRALRRLGHLHERDRAVVEALSLDLVNALLPVSTATLEENQLE